MPQKSRRVYADPGGAQFHKRHAACRKMSSKGNAELSATCTRRTLTFITRKRTLPSVASAGRAFERRRETHNHGQTKLILMPASAGVQLMMKEIARACYLLPQLSCFDNLDCVPGILSAVIPDGERNNQPGQP